MKKMNLGNEGMIAIETLIAFVGFLLFTSVIITWVNLAAVQLRTHHALTQTALEVSFYAHALQVVGLVDMTRGMNSLGAGTRGEIDGVIGNAFGMWDAVSDGRGHLSDLTSIDPGGIISNPNDAFNNASSSVQGIQNAWDTGRTEFSAATDTFGEWADDPMGLFRGIVQIAGQEAAIHGASLVLGNAIAPSFFWRYMGIDGVVDGRGYFNAMPVRTDTVTFRREMSIDDLRVGISGLRPSTMILVGDNADEIQLYLEYYVDFSPFFILQGEPRFGTRVTQTVATRAWVGDGSFFDASVTPPSRP